MDRLLAALDAYDAARDPEAAAEIERGVWERLGQERAALVLDMSGFSRTVRRHGLVFFLSLMRRMQRIAAPEVARAGGEVLRFEADNLFATFDDVGPALAGAEAILAALAAANHGQPADRQVRASIGVAYGRMLIVPGHAFYGDACNIAYKLGEDLAEPGEILIEAEAAARLPPATQTRLTPRDHKVSGLTLAAFSLTPPG